MDRTYFFIIGAPRSGTTMLQMALNRHSRILIPPETHYFVLPSRSRRGQLLHWRLIQNDLGMNIPPPPRRIRRDSSAREPYLRLIDSYVARHGDGDVDFIGEKSNTHTRHVPFILQYLSDARFILIDRDGRDVALSLSQAPWMPDNPDVGFALWMFYQRLQRRMLEDYPERICHVKSEDLVRDPQLYLRGILEFLGLEYHPAVVHGSGNRGGIPDFEMDYKGRALEPITEERIGRWRRDLSLEQIERFERWGGKLSAPSATSSYRTGGRSPLGGGRYCTPQPLLGSSVGGLSSGSTGISEPGSHTRIEDFLVQIACFHDDPEYMLLGRRRWPRLRGIAIPRWPSESGGLRKSPR